MVGKVQQDLDKRKTKARIAELMTRNMQTAAQHTRLKEQLKIFGPLLEGLKPYRESALCYNLFFTVRRTLLLVMALFCHHYPYFQC